MPSYPSNLDGAAADDRPNLKFMSDQIKLDIGSGRVRDHGFTTVDKTQFVDNNGENCVDIVVDIESDVLPHKDASVDVIRVDNVLEHLTDLRHAMNEFHRVLKPDGHLIGMVPIAGSEPDYQDPTHVRHFIVKTFEYFTGSNPAKIERPSHPRYADYGFLPWHKIKVEQGTDNDSALIFFDLMPRK